MKETLKQLIIDFHHSQIPIPDWRNFTLPNLPPEIRKAFVFVGMRRSGKTWCLYQQIQILIKQGVKLEQIFYLNFADDRLFEFKAEHFKLIISSYFELYPQYLNNPNIHFFFDEIHEITGWEKFIRRLLDTEKFSLYISGSSAKMLSTEIATQLRGRVIIQEVFPLSFYEQLHVVDPALLQLENKFISSQQKILINVYLQEYLRRGGFPEILSIFKIWQNYLKENNNTLLKTADFGVTSIVRYFLQSYIDSVIHRDIVDRHKIKNTLVIKYLLTHCLQNSAKLFSAHKIYKDLKSQQYKISKDSLYKFMSYFEDAYCVFSVSNYGFSLKKREHSPKKIYPIDTGLITAYTIKEPYEQATRFETAVFLHLRRQKNQLFYYKTKSDREIDFLTLSPQNEINLYQAVYDLSQLETLTREVRALQQAMEELKLETGTLITLDENEAKAIKVPQGKIYILPLWKLLLETKN